VPQTVKVSLVPVFTSGELSALRKACPGRSFADRRDAAVLAVFEATGIRLSELAGIRYCPDDPPRGDLNLYGREIRVFGKGGTPRIVAISYEAARSLDRYLRVRAGHPLAGRPELWLGVSGRGPLTPAGIYQLVARRGEQAGVAAHPQRFRHHVSHTWLDRGGAEGDLMQLNGWSSPQMLTWYGASARGARARRTYDRIMNDVR
jgi:integrase